MFFTGHLAKYMLCCIIDSGCKKGIGQILHLEKIKSREFRSMSNNAKEYVGFQCDKGICILDGENSEPMYMNVLKKVMKMPVKPD